MAGGLQPAGFADHGQADAHHQAHVLMMWDEENLYLAMHNPLRPGERLLQSQRRDRGPDPAIFADDLYEIWISVDATDPISGNRHCSSQFLANLHSGHDMTPWSIRGSAARSRRIPAPSSLRGIAPTRLGTATTPVKVLSLCGFRVYAKILAR